MFISVILSALRTPPSDPGIKAVLVQAGSSETDWSLHRDSRKSVRRGGWGGGSRTVRVKAEHLEGKEEGGEIITRGWWGNWDSFKARRDHRTTDFTLKHMIFQIVLGVIMWSKNYFMNCKIGCNVPVCFVCVFFFFSFFGLTYMIRNMKQTEPCKIILPPVFETRFCMTPTPRGKQRRPIKCFCTGPLLSTGGAPMLFQPEVIVTPSKGRREGRRVGWSGWRTGAFIACLAWQRAVSAQLNSGPVCERRDWGDRSVDDFLHHESTNPPTTTHTHSQLCSDLVLTWASIWFTCPQGSPPSGFYSSLSVQLLGLAGPDREPFSISHENAKRWEIIDVFKEFTSNWIKIKLIIKQMICEQY